MAINWEQCQQAIKDEIGTEMFRMWIQPLVANFDGSTLKLYAANKFILSWVKDEYLILITGVLNQLYGDDAPSLQLLEGNPTQSSFTANVAKQDAAHTSPKLIINEDEGVTKPNSRSNSASNIPDDGVVNTFKRKDDAPASFRTNVDPKYTFDNFVEGKSNQLARAAATQVSTNPGVTYNPLFLYGSTGLGKTHLIHAIGNEILAKNKSAKVVYMHSERFVQDMVKALQNNAIEQFKRFYRSVDALLIDDIQLFAGKERSQEEFFHTFNSLLDGNSQIIATSDRYPKEIENIEERLVSRLGWGLTVMIEPPELETRVAILLSKAKLHNFHLPDEVAFFIAKRLRANVRELEGALNRVIANANFTGKAATIDFVRETLRDLLALQDKLVTIDNIIKTVAEYYKIKVSDILSKSRTRSVARPRQIAMALAKDLTSNSYPEIGNSFGGRDHTTVIHAVRKIQELRVVDADISQDYNNLSRILST